MVIGIIAVLSAFVSVLVCMGTDAFQSLVWLWLLPVSWLGSFLSIIVLAFLLVLVMCAFVDLEKEERKDNRFYRAVLYMIADAAHTVLQVRVHAEGMEKIPANRRVLLVCNHLNNADPVIIKHKVIIKVSAHIFRGAKLSANIYVFSARKSGKLFRQHSLLYIGRHLQFCGDALLSGGKLGFFTRIRCYVPRHL